MNQDTTCCKIHLVWGKYKIGSFNTDVHQIRHRRHTCICVHIISCLSAGSIYWSKPTTYLMLAKPNMKWFQPRNCVIVNTNWVVLCVFRPFYCNAKNLFRIRYNRTRNSSTLNSPSTYGFVSCYFRISPMHILILSSYNRQVSGQSILLILLGFKIGCCRFPDKITSILQGNVWMAIKLLSN